MNFGKFKDMYNLAPTESFVKFWNPILDSLGKDWGGIVYRILHGPIEYKVVREVALNDFVTQMS